MKSEDGLENDAEWAKVRALIELAKSAHSSPLTPERRQRIRQGLMQRLERERVDRLAREGHRRMMARGFVAGASTMLVAGLLLKLVGGGLPWAGQASTAPTKKPAIQRVVTE